MSISYSMRTEDDLLVVVASGADDSVEQVKSYGEAVIMEALRTGSRRILCLETDLEYRLTTSETFEVASHIAEYAPRVARVALVCNPAFADDAAFWENVVNNRGLTVRFFPDELSGRRWLAANWTPAAAAAGC